MRLKPSSTRAWLKPASTKVPLLNTTRLRGRIAPTGNSVRPAYLASKTALGSGKKVGGKPDPESLRSVLRPCSSAKCGLIRPGASTTAHVAPLICDAELAHAELLQKVSEFGKERTNCAAKVAAWRIQLACGRMASRICNLQLCSLTN
ncbi:hypothetical protein MES4922_20141 [Mesorhizobium ventifaucium]|uniref:Uncharacterized protein n=1 Tax=Mesorhizobium ventifaucium TaxID=666020 RepID=A0ABM9DPE5_9HYPH|nr:hypothetical protein MES4922_20141 [Mesorhizobium ventifaucium]